MEEIIKKCLGILYEDAEIISGTQNVHKKLLEHFAKEEEYAEQMAFNKMFGTYFVVLYDRSTREVYAVTGEGLPQEAPDSSLFMYKSNLIAPYFNTAPQSEKDMLAACEKASEIFDKDNNAAREKGLREGKKPLILVKRIEANTYQVYSLQERTFMFIDEYKEYRTTFRFLERSDKPEDYTVYAPTQEYIENLSLMYVLIPDIWKRNYAWDQPELMPEHTPIEVNLIPDEQRKIYNLAIILINKENTRESINHDEVRHLESRLLRYERLIELQAPKIIIKKQFYLVKESIDKIFAESGDSYRRYEEFKGTVGNEMI